MSAASRAAVKPAHSEIDPAHRRAVLMLLATAILWSLGGLLIKWVTGIRWPSQGGEAERGGIMR